MWLVNRALAGSPIPDELPPNILAPPSSSGPQMQRKQSFMEAPPVYYNQDPADFAQK